MKRKISRRSFIKFSALTDTLMGINGLSCARGGKTSVEELLEKISQNVPGTGKPVIRLTVPPIPQVKVGIIGLGNRGTTMTHQVHALFPHKAKITAICDIRNEKAEKTFEFLKEKRALGMSKNI